MDLTEAAPKIIDTEESQQQTAFFKAKEEQKEKAAIFKAQAQPIPYPGDCIHDYAHITDPEMREIFVAEEDEFYKVRPAREPRRHPDDERDSATESERRFCMRTKIKNILDTNNKYDIQQAQVEHMAEKAIKGVKAHTILCIRRSMAERRILQLQGYHHELRKSAKRQVNATASELDSETKKAQARKIRTDLGNYISDKIYKYFQDNTSEEIRLKDNIGRILCKIEPQPEEAKTLTTEHIQKQQIVKDYKTKQEEGERLPLITYC